MAIAKSSAKTGVVKVGLYARVSTHDQQTLPMQLTEMRAYAKRRSWKVALEEKEVGSGATAASASGLSRLPRRSI